MIKVKNLCKSFEITTRQGFFKKTVREKKTIINNVNLEIPAGKIIGLLGVNGAGKTTTIKMLSTMLSPSSGTITIDGVDAVADSFNAKKKLNLISGGERSLYWRLSAKENLEYFGSLYGVSPSCLRKKIDDILELVNLTEVANIPVEKYSKGMKQRLQIARGLVNDPSYLFLDEPTLGLDIVIAKEFRKYIKRLATVENKGILLTSHYISEIEELCDYVYFLKDGSIYFHGTPENIKKMFTLSNQIIITATSFPILFIKEMQSLEGVEKLSLTQENRIMTILVTNDSLINQIFELLKKNNVNLTNFTVKEASLEDSIFSALERGK